MISLLWKSFYDANAYNLVLKTWKFKTVIYFFFVSLIASVFADLSSIPYLYNFLNDEAQTVSTQIPNCKITESGFDFKSENPIYVKLSNGRDFIAFTQNFIPADKIENLLLAFEKDWICFNLNDGFEKRIPYSEILTHYKRINPQATEININPDTAQKFIEYLKSITLFIFPLFNFAFAVMISALMLFSVTIPTYILSLNLMPDIKLSEAIKVALIASTPAIILSSLGGLFSNFGSFVFALLSFVIVWKMMRRLAILRIQEKF